MKELNEKMIYTSLSNPFTHICCGCGLTHEVHFKISKNGKMMVGFQGNIKKSVKNFKGGIYVKNKKI